VFSNNLFIKLEVESEIYHQMQYINT